MKIWRDLIALVDTKYVYIGRDVVHFTSFDKLERIVRQVNSLNAYFIAGASRTLVSGEV